MSTKEVLCSLGCLSTTGNNYKAQSKISHNTTQKVVHQAETMIYVYTRFCLYVQL